jgi:hypothetical protein
MSATTPSRRVRPERNSNTPESANSPVIIAEALAVQDAHLLENCTLAGLAGAEQEQLDLVLIALEVLTILQRREGAAATPCELEVAAFSESTV